MNLNDLEDKKVVVWGAGREASAFVHAVRNRKIPVDISIVDEHGSDYEVEGIKVKPFSIDELDAADVVVRSPGVSIYRPELMGRIITTPTALWFAEPHSQVVAVTGTKGKSTTSALLSHVLDGLGINVRLAGNIGRAPLDFTGEPEPQIWVVELSSFQISDADARPDIAILTSLDSDHLDWHGDRQHYVDDKLRLFAHAKHSIVNVADRGARAVLDRLPNVVAVDDKTEVPNSKLFGRHNSQLIRLVVSALKVLGIDTEALAEDIAGAVGSFEPLPHRLELVRELDGVLYVNDSLSTNPVAATAAIKAFIGRPISVLLGGYDRGLSFEDFGAFLSKVPELRIFTMPDCGPRIADSVIGALAIIRTDGLHQAVSLAQSLTPKGGVVLLAPAAASFTQFKSYAQRGEEFCRLVNLL